MCVLVYCIFNWKESRNCARKDGIYTLFRGLGVNNNLGQSTFISGIVLFTFYTIFLDQIEINDTRIEAFA